MCARCCGRNSKSRDLARAETMRAAPGAHSRFSRRRTGWKCRSPRKIRLYRSLKSARKSASRPAGGENFPTKTADARGADSVRAKHGGRERGCGARGSLRECLGGGCKSTARARVISGRRRGPRAPRGSGRGGASSATRTATPPRRRGSRRRRAPPSTGCWGRPRPTPRCRCRTSRRRSRACPSPRRRRTPDRPSAPRCPDPWCHRCGGPAHRSTSHAELGCPRPAPSLCEGPCSRGEHPAQPSTSASPRQLASASLLEDLSAGAL
mmetsp:Transcript_90269/g.251135  ORF Transcript_90269/g.251135 Transcript_90269/m.251135 type:complete len:266 (-) Transcript_90269:54-851(-)